MMKNVSSALIRQIYPMSRPFHATETNIELENFRSISLKREQGTDLSEAAPRTFPSGQT